MRLEPVLPEALKIIAQYPYRVALPVMASKPGSQNRSFDWCATALGAIEFRLPSKEFPKEQREGGTRSDTAQGPQRSGLWDPVSRHRAMQAGPHPQLLRRGGESEHPQRRRPARLALRASRKGGDSQAS